MVGEKCGGGGGESMIRCRSELFVVNGGAVLQPSWFSLWNVYCKTLLLIGLEYDLPNTFSKVLCIWFCKLELGGSPFYGQRMKSIIFICS